MSRRAANAVDVGYLTMTVNAVGIEETLNMLAAICAQHSNACYSANNADKTCLGWDYVGTYLSALADKVPAVLK